MFFHSKPKRISFEDARSALVILLEDVGENWWLEKLSSIHAYSFKSLLGGMGSFTDLVICPENNHRITEERTPLANELLTCLRGICYIVGQEGSLSPERVIAVCGRTQFILSGWRCLSCGHSQISRQDARYFHASIEVHKALGRGIEALLQLWESAENSDEIQEIIAMAERSGIRIAEGTGWMRPCPSCKSHDTCVYRWYADNKLFLPTADNLPLRTRRST